jgi:L-threonylcarbamoyladenylate synthase
MTTELLSTDSQAALAHAVERAVELLDAGEPVALPTETVYGLAGDATRADAAVKIFEAKERPRFDPLIVHLPNESWLERVARTDSPLVGKLVERFWPGPLTLVLPRREIIPNIVTAGLDTVAVRMSAHPVFRAVIARFGKPLAAPSANRFGRISPTTAQHVCSELDGRIALIVDGGATPHGIESTIVAPAGDRLRILRAGPVTAEMLAGFGAVELGPAGNSVEAPGQFQSHYAPRTPLRLVPRAAFGVQDSTIKVGLLAFTPIAAADRFVATEVLSPTGDLREAAATLFAKMRRLDEAGLELIVAEPVPEHGLGVAIMERLRKAAARDPASAVANSRR